MFLPPHHSALCNLSLFLSSFFLSCCVLFGFFSFLSFLPLSTHCPLPFQLTFCLSSVFFNFLAVFHLCCCAPFNLFWSILPLPLVPSSLSPSLSLFQPLFVLISLSLPLCSPACIFFSHKGPR